MSTIFVSYRRSDSSDVTGRIFDQLRIRYGAERLFKDVDSIPYGTDFRKVIEEAVRRCDVLLAVIGDDWLSVLDEKGNRRIDNGDDYVNIEISSALERAIPVIPVLVEGTEMPNADQLPESLRPLAYRNAAKVRPDPDFHNDIDRLCKELRRYGFLSSGLTAHWYRWKMFVGTVLLLCLIGATVLASLTATGIVKCGSQQGDLKNRSENPPSETEKPKLILDAPVDFIEE